MTASFLLQMDSLIKLAVQERLLYRLPLYLLFLSSLIKNNTSDSR
jgi:hypothetical protein